MCNAATDWGGRVRDAENAMAAEAVLREYNPANVLQLYCTYDKGDRSGKA